jgi:hypothetical protein
MRSSRAEPAPLLLTSNVSKVVSASCDRIEIALAKDRLPSNALKTRTRHGESVAEM